MKKTLFKILIYFLTIIHLSLLVGIFYFENKNNYVEKKVEIPVNMKLYDNKPLVLKISDKVINLNTDYIETGKILVIDDQLVFNIEDIKTYYAVYDDFLVLIFKENKNYRLVFIDSNCNVLKDLKKYKRNNEIFSINGDNPLKLYKNRIIIEMKSNTSIINYKLKWKDNVFYEDINIIK